MVETLRAAAHDLIERRARHVLFDRTREPNYQDGVTRNLRGPDDGEIERRDHRGRDCQSTAMPTFQWPAAQATAPTENRIATIIASRTSRLIHKRSLNGFFIRWIGRLF